jgi:lipoprotein-anchoring transpeptidase ErfK/SrfK
VYASVTLLDQLLARLNYLPVSFTPTTPQALSNTAEVPGTFAWRFAALPKVLSALWQVGTTNVVLRGAVMRFQGVHNLTTTGVANGATWQALIAAIRVHQVDPDPYDYVYVSEREPETLDLYRNGHLIFISLVNTGVAAAPTAPGTYPVYVRYLTTTMSGTEPDGKKYNDPGIPWVSYFHGGDALHGFIRSSYGWPQSLGCVEMPFANAHRVFPWTPIGTLVSIS